MSGPALLSAGPVIWQDWGASLDLDWPELGPDCPGRPTDKQQQSTARHSRAQHSTTRAGQARSRQLTTDNSNRDPFLLPWIFPRLDISTTNPSSHYHSATHPPPTLASLVARDTSSQPSPQPRHHRSRTRLCTRKHCSPLLAITAAAF